MTHRHIFCKAHTRTIVSENFSSLPILDDVGKALVMFLGRSFGVQIGHLAQWTDWNSIIKADSFQIIT